MQTAGSTGTGIESAIRSSGFTMEEKQSILQNMVKENPQMKEEESFIRFLQDNHIQI